MMEKGKKILHGHVFISIQVFEIAGLVVQVCKHYVQPTQYKGFCTRHLLKDLSSHKGIYKPGTPRLVR